MRAPRLYVTTAESLNERLTENCEFSLSKAHSHYIKNVLRLTNQAPLVLFNGDGGEYHCEIIALKKSSCLVQVKTFNNINVESSLEIHLAQALSKGDKMEYSIQKAVELGVRSIIPIQCEHSVVKLNKVRLEKKMQYWQQIAIHACQQSGRNFVPKVQPILSFQEAILQNGFERILLAPGQENSLSKLAAPNSPTMVFIGPEGGLSKAEIQFATEHQSKTVSLGPRILRTETAGLAVISAMQALWGDC